MVRRAELSDEERARIAGEIELIRNTTAVSWAELARRVHAASGETITGEALRRATTGRLGAAVARAWALFMRATYAAPNEFPSLDELVHRNGPSALLPSRERAIQLVADKVSDQAVAYVRMLPVPGDADPGEDHWIAELEAAERRRRQFEERLTDRS